MQFYCPDCQKTVDITDTTTVTTKMGKTAYKAKCPDCSLDLAFYDSQSGNPPPTTAPTSIDTGNLENQVMNDLKASA